MHLIPLHFSTIMKSMFQIKFAVPTRVAASINRKTIIKPSSPSLSNQTFPPPPFFVDCRHSPSHHPRVGFNLRLPFNLILRQNNRTPIIALYKSAPWSLRLCTSISWLQFVKRPVPFCAPILAQAHTMGHQVAKTEKHYLFWEGFVVHASAIE